MSIKVHVFDLCKGALSQMTVQFVLAVPAGESSDEFVLAGKEAAPHQEERSIDLLTPESDECSSSEGSLHGHVCEINGLGQLELGRRRSMENVVFSLWSSGRDGERGVAKLVARTRGRQVARRTRVTCDAPKQSVRSEIESQNISVLVI